jgi:AraC family transcriptional regulator
VSEVTCTFGPQDHPFEEQHSLASIAIVASGSFQYRSRAGYDLMTPGCLMLINAGECFECGHKHGTGDRCISFSYAPEFFDWLEVAPRFRALRIPPIRALSPLIAHASAAMAGAVDAPWAELGVRLAVETSQLERGLSGETDSAGAGATARVTRVVRAIENEPDGNYELSAMARDARLSPYHFLRTFQKVTGVTPHQYLLRRRLHRAAVKLRTEDTRVVDIALESGFGDLTNFNRTFRAEFGVSPRVWRKSGS